MLDDGYEWPTYWEAHGRFITTPGDADDLAHLYGEHIVIAALLAATTPALQRY